MRLIDADALNDRMYHEAFETDTDMQRWDSGCWIRYKMFENAIAEAPIIDIVRCKDCKNHEDFPTGISPITCSLSWGGVFENDFCSYGERKEGASDEDT